MIFFLSFILSLCMTIRPKNRVLINLFFLFVHDHSTKLGVTLTVSFNLFLDVPIFRLLYSWTILPLYFHCSLSGSTAVVFCPLYSQQYYQEYQRAQLFNILGTTYLSYTIFIGELLLYFVHYIHGYMKSQPVIALLFYISVYGRKICNCHYFLLFLFLYGLTKDACPVFHIC